MTKIITHESPREFREVKQHEYLFRFFFNSMLTEMDEHHEQNNGNSWLVQDRVSTGHRSVTEMEEWLDILLFGMVDKYKETKDVGKLIHIANFCAMRTLRERLQSSDTMTIKEDNWCDEGKHVGVPTHFTNPDGTPVIHCTICGKQLQSSQKGENGINKERLLAMRLEVLGTTLDGPDFKDEPIEQGVLEGLLFNIGKLLLEHLEEHRGSETSTRNQNEN